MPTDTPLQALHLLLSLLFHSFPLSPFSYSLLPSKHRSCSSSRDTCIAGAFFHWLSELKITGLNRGLDKRSKVTTKGEVVGSTWAFPRQEHSSALGNSPATANPGEEGWHHSRWILKGTDPQTGSYSLPPRTGTQGRKPALCVASGSPPSGITLQTPPSHPQPPTSSYPVQSPRISAQVPHQGWESIKPCFFQSVLQRNAALRTS